MIVLLGMPGCGKSAVAQRLGRQRGLPVFDTDDLVFSVHGDVLGQHPDESDWKSFREKEREAAIGALQNSVGVVALGGGAWMDDDVRSLARSGHLSVYLSCTIDTLARRNASGRRVMFNRGPIQENLLSLLAQRERFYAMADLTLIVDSLSEQETADQILRSKSREGVDHAIS